MESIAAIQLLWLPMPEQAEGLVAIVDYESGNLFSVERACEYVGLRTVVTSSPDEIWGADAVILPGVGAFGNAMDSLRRLDLVSLLRDVAASGKTFVGICLGMQLLLGESSEFSRHEGLGIVGGDVRRLAESTEGTRKLKVPQVGWNRVHRYALSDQENGNQSDCLGSWRSDLMTGIPDEAYMYFVHSYYTMLLDPTVTVSTSKYGDTEFISSFQQGSIFACQFHPERSGPTGLTLYRNLAEKIALGNQGSLHA